MDTEALIRRLMATFLLEFEDHTRALDRDLLAFERTATGDERAELFKSMFRTAHSLKGAAHSVNVTLVQSTCHRLESILGAARDGRLTIDGDVVEVLFTAADALKDACERLRSGSDLAAGPLPGLAGRLDTVVEIASAGRPSSRSGPADDVAPVTNQSTERPLADGSVRVQAAKLDRLLDRVGESVVARRRTNTHLDSIHTLQTVVEQVQVEWERIRKSTALIRSKDAFERGTGHLKQLTRGIDALASRVAVDQHVLEQAIGPLEDEVRRLRMQPFAIACQGLERVVRDLARVRGIDAQLVIEGGAVELDRAILEALGDSLLHLVRNAVAHGLEPRHEREARAKPARGVITVVAELRGTGVDVIVADDGRGLDLGQLAAAAREWDIAVPSDDDELAQLVFVPGFSTASLVTELSGRGIGLDVVKHQVESLRGSVSVSSIPGLGSRFTLALPLTLTTVRGLLVECSGHALVLPTASITRLTRETPPRFGTIEGADVLLGGSEPVPIASLAETLGLTAATGSQPKHVSIAVVCADARQVAFVIDELIEEQDFVIKGLGPRFRALSMFSGATMLPSGRLALILNPDALVSMVLSNASVRTSVRARESAGSGKRRRILVVDDSITTRGLEKLILEAAGYEVVVAADGLAAWQRLEAEAVDLVVSDVEMPRMDGFGLLQAIRGSEHFRALPVILVTALESPEDRARGLALGADAYLPKSKFNQGHLIHAIASLL